jgi:thiamine transport system permease protein
VVTLPALVPAILSAAALVFTFTFTSFGVIRVLGGVGRATIEVEVWRRATQLGDIGRAATLTVLQLCILAVAVGWAARMFAKSVR